MKASHDESSQLMRAHDRVLALSRTATGVQALLDPDRVLQTIGDELRDQGLNCVFGLLDDEQAQVVLRHTNVSPHTVHAAEEMLSVRTTGFSFAADASAHVAAVVRDGKTTFEEHLADRARELIPHLSTETTRELLQLLQAHRTISAPLIAGSDILGFLTVWSEDLTEEDIPTVSVMAQQAAVALERAKLYEDTMLRVFEMEALRQTTLDITRQLDLSQLLRLIVERAAALSKTKGGGLYLHYPDRNELELVVSHNLGRDYTGLCLQPGEGLSGRVFLTGEPLAVEDYSSWQNRSSKFDDSRFGGVVAIPLKWGERTIGVLNLTDGVGPRLFKERDLWLPEWFADHAAVAIENARLFADKEHKIKQLAALHEVSLEILAETDPSRLLLTIVQKACELLDAEAGAIDLFDPKSQQLEMKYSHGYNKDYSHIRLSPGQGVAGTVCETRQPLAIDDYANWTGRVRQVDQAEISAALGVPLLRGDELLGVLTIDRRTPRSFNDEDIQLATLFAAQAAIAIDNSRLYEETSQRAEELEGLYQVSTEIAAQLDLDALLDTIVQRAMDLLDADAGGLYLYHPQSQDLELIAERGHIRERKGTRLVLGEGACGKVAESGEPVVVRDYGSWEGRSPHFEDEPTCNAMAVPIKQGGSLLGAFFVDDANLDRAFGDRDLRLANLFANQAAIAIQNARFFGERERTIRQLAALQDVSLEVVAKTNLAEVLPTIVRVAAQLLEAQAGGIDLFDPRSEELVLNAVYGYDDSLIGMRHALGEGVVGRVAQTRKPIIVEDYSSWEGRSPLWRSQPVGTVIGVPLLRGEQFLGALTIDRPVSQPFDDRDVNLATLFANQAAIAIKNAQTVAATERRVTELTALTKISLQLTQSLDLDTVLDTIVRSAVELVEASDAHIFLYDEDGERFTFGSGAWSPGIDRIPFKDVRANGLTANVATRGQPVIINEAKAHPLFTDMVDQDSMMEAIAGFPLKRSDKVLGVFNVAFLEPHTFDQDELRVLTLLADQAAIAIENARLYEETERRLKETQTLQEVSRVVNLSLDPGQVFQTVVERLASAFGYDMVSIYIMEEKGLRLGAEVGYDPAQIIDFIPLTKGVIGRVARTGEPELLPDVTVDPDFLSAARGVVSEITVPITKDDQVLGVLNVESTDVSPLTESDLCLLSSMAHQVSVAIQNAQLYQAAQRELLERQRAEEAYRAVVEHSLQGVVILQGSRVMFANQALADIVGYTTEELLAMSPAEVEALVHPEDQQLVWGRFRDRIGGEAVPPHYECRAIRKDGSVVRIEMFSSRVDYNGRPAVQAAIVDITERKRAEEALLESEERYRSLFKDSRDAVFITSREGTIVDVNESFLSLFSIDREDLAHLNMKDLYADPGARASFQAEIEEKGSVRDYEVRLAKLDGTPIDGLTSSTLWVDADGNTLGYRGIIRDVTERKRRQEELQQSYSALRNTLEGTVNALAALAETRDPYTAGHQERVANLACAIAGEMGLSEAQIQGIRMAGLVHDIGKIHIPAEILSKPTQLTEIEMQMIRTHPQTAYDILCTVEFPWPVASVVLQHHERVDGSGYPHGLADSDILLEARILAVADVVEAMASDRPYRPAHGIDEALAEIEERAGTLYDNQVVQACLRLFREKGFDLQSKLGPPA